MDNYKMYKLKKRERGSIVGSLFLVIIPLLIIGGVVLGMYQWYLSKRRALYKAVKSLPEFSEEEAAKEAAKELKLPYPPQDVKVSYKEVKERIKHNLKRKVKQKFSPKAYSKQIIAIMKKYGKAKKGQLISFQLKNSNDIISGRYMGREIEQNQGVYIHLSGDRKFLITDILPEYMYLFNNSDSQVTIQKKLKEFKAHYGKKKKEYILKLKAKLERKYFTEAGFVKDEHGRWKEPAVLIAEKVALKRKIFETSRRKKIKTLQEKYKFLGVFTISLPDEKKEKIENRFQK